MGFLGSRVGVTPDGWLGGREVGVMDACTVEGYWSEGNLGCPVPWVAMKDRVDAQGVAVVGYI